LRLYDRNRTEHRLEFADLISSEWTTPILVEHDEEIVHLQCLVVPQKHFHPFGVGISKDLKASEHAHLYLDVVQSPTQQPLSVLGYLSQSSE